MVDHSSNISLKQFLDSHEIIEGEEPTGDISSLWIIQNEDLQALEEGIPLVNFVEQAPNRNKEMEFRIIRRITETQKHNDELEDYNPEIAKLNRYNNIIPYKHSRVKLDPLEYEQKEDDPDNTYSYINANYINTSFNDKKKIIACQGPIPTSFQNHWKMVFAENVDTIFMLCNFRENNKPQCDEYWPKSVGAFFEFPKGLEKKELRVTLESEAVIEQTVTERVFTVEKNEGGEFEKKTVTHIQMTGWPDHGSPKDEDFELMNRAIEKMINVHVFKPDKKILVHCSAGVGRTGTLIALFNLVLALKKLFSSLLQEKENPKNSEEELKQYKISIFGVVRRLREQRWGMVHSSEQYLYLYKFLTKYISNILA